MCCSTQGQQRAPRWKLAWHDEFNQPDGSSPDPSKWTVVTGGNGWGNDELEYYTSRPRNVHIQNGKLVIRALQETYTGPDQVTSEFTSARLQTKGHFAQKYGRFEARIRIPKGQGMWPAFWMLGDDIDKTHWPACGEIDVVENIGREPSNVHGTIHGPGYSGSEGISAKYELSGGRRFDRKFHVFAVEWKPNVIRFYVDGDLYRTITPAALPKGTQWVYDHPFFLLLNLAIGGNWPGAPDRTTSFPQEMQVDFVRVFTRDDILDTR